MILMRMETMAATRRQLISYCLDFLTFGKVGFIMALKSKKAVKKLIIITVIAAAVIVPILILLFEYISYLNYLEEEEAICKEMFKDYCEYVEVNQEVYENFSKYQISLYDNGNTDMEIEREGEYQEWRDIVFNNISRASVHTNDYGVYVVYEKLWDPYDILICYQNNLHLFGRSESDTLVYITDNISVRMRRVR